MFVLLFETVPILCT